MKIAMAGSTGFIGTHLVSHFEKQGHHLILLSRKRDSEKSHYWNPESKEIDPNILEGVDIAINLSGENIMGRWNQKKMEQIRNSRLVSTQFFCDTILGLKNPPSLFINASAVGYYGDRKGEILTEVSPPGKDFLADVCADWEKIPESLLAKNIRLVFTRFGIVLGSGGGALKPIEKAFRTGMGGVLGDGKQMMSWIAIDDVCQAIQHVIENAKITGPVNFTAPKAVSNLEFTEKVGKILHRPTVVPVPKFVLSMFFGEGAQMFLSSVNAYPQRLLESGFKFQYPEIEDALKKYLLTNA